MLFPRCRRLLLLSVVSVVSVLAMGEHRAMAEPFRPFWRPAADLGGGMLGAAGGAVSIGFLSYGAARLAGAEDVCSAHGCIFSATDGWALFGAVAGGIAGTGFGTWGAGRLSGGNGKLWATFAGEAVGLAAAGILVARDRTIGSWPWTLAPLFVGAVVGYELSARDEGGATSNQQPSLGGRTPAILPLSFGVF